MELFWETDTDHGFKPSRMRCYLIDFLGTPRIWAKSK